MKILIYGLGKEALFAKKAMKKEHRIIGFTDSFANIKSYAGLNFYDRKTIKQVDFDYIILALSNRNISENIKEKLVNEGIKAEKIVDFMQLFARQKVDKVMCRTDSEKMDGMILGLSHALFGINPDYLPGKWKNLAIPGEDLYYHYQVLRKCADSYSNIIENLQYAIVDMYDYPVFNYDVSLSKNIIDYWSMGGYIEDLHHFNKNKNFIGNVNDEIKKRGFYYPTTDKRKFQFTDELFDIRIIEHGIEYLYMNEPSGNDGFRDYPIQLKLDKIISDEPWLPCNLFYMGGRRYSETIEENTVVLEKLVKLLKQINPKIKIYFLLIPRFKKIEKYHARILDWEKEEFENIMDRYLKDDNCYYFDFKQCAEINSNRYFFWDAAHLNYMGGIAFTELVHHWIEETGI